jgi:AcrR family transcriptional regulator
MSTDRRVQRSRAALLAAAVALVSERGTTAVPVTDLAAAANVSRQLIYLQFGDRDALLVAAAADLVTRELLDHAEHFHGDTRHGVLATTRHFAGHRSFYRAMLTGSCAYAMTRTLNRVFGPFNQRFLRERFAGLDEETAADLSRFLAAGAGEIINDWLVDGPLDPGVAADRLLRLAAVFPKGALR